VAAQQENARALNVNQSGVGIASSLPHQLVFLQVVANTGALFKPQDNQHRT
jgi:hypothetical protein